MSFAQSGSTFEGEDGAVICAPSLPNAPLPSYSTVDSTQLLEIGASDHLQKFTDLADAYSIISVQNATPEALARAKAYYSNIEFAWQLCGDFAAAESGNPALSVPLAEARKMLGLIVEHNSHLKSPSSDRPVCPRHEALIRFDLPLQRLTTQWLGIKNWRMNFVVLRGTRLYCYANDKGGCFCSNDSFRPVHESHEDALALMRTNPTPDGNCCFDLKGVHARCVMVGVAAHVCDTHAQDAALLAAATMGRHLVSLSFSIETRCTLKFMCTRAHTCHKSQCRICTLLPPMMPPENSA
jgi:hypothetical protein